MVATGVPYQEALSAARSDLRLKQASGYPVATPQNWDKLAHGTVLGEALEHYKKMTAVEAKTAETVSRGGFVYFKSAEEERIARGEAILRRTEPGLLEDPNYLAFLSLQAASIELSLSWQTTKLGWPHLDGTAEERAESIARCLLGTVHSPDINAMSSSWRVDTGNFRIVLLNSGLIDFVYQAAKATIEAGNPQPDPSGRTISKIQLAPDAVQRQLDLKPAPIDRMYATLEAYIYKGYPRAVSNEVVPGFYYPPLSMLTNLAERWMIAHEYGHGLIPPTLPDDPMPAGHTAEYLSDAVGTVATVSSAAYFDLVPPENPLGSAIFALACLNIRKEALSIAQSGVIPADQPHANPVASSHPAVSDRIAGVVNSFRRYFDVEYSDDGRFELRMIVRDETPGDHGFSQEHIDRSLSFANALQMIWHRCQPRIRDDFLAGRSVHPRWL